MNLPGCTASRCNNYLHDTKCGSTSDPSINKESKSDIFQGDPRDTVLISDEARTLYQKETASAKESDNSDSVSSEQLNAKELAHDGHMHNHDEDHDEHEHEHDNKIKQESELDEAEMRELQELKSRDREVKTHEQAHINASGSIPTSAPSYDYETGPDGQRYAVGGSVSYKMPSTDCPEEQIKLAQQLKRMALAPAQPSSKDRSIAAKATQKESQARQKLAEERAEEAKQAEEKSESDVSSTSKDVERHENTNSSSNVTSSISHTDDLEKNNEESKVENTAPKHVRGLIQAYTDNLEKSATGSMISAFA